MSCKNEESHVAVYMHACPFFAVVSSENTIFSKKIKDGPIKKFVQKYTPNYAPSHYTYSLHLEPIGLHWTFAHTQLSTKYSSLLIKIATR